MELKPNSPKAINSIFTYIFTFFISFLQLKYQADHSISPFSTNPLTILLCIVWVLLYCCAYYAASLISLPSISHSPYLPPQPQPPSSSSLPPLSPPYPTIARYSPQRLQPSSSSSLPPLLQPSSSSSLPPLSPPYPTIARYSPQQLQPSLSALAYATASLIPSPPMSFPLVSSTSPPPQSSTSPPPQSSTSPLPPPPQPSTSQPSTSQPPTRQSSTSPLPPPPPQPSTSQPPTRQPSMSPPSTTSPSFSSPTPSPPPLMSTQSPPPTSLPIAAISAKGYYQKMMIIFGALALASLGSLLFPSSAQHYALYTMYAVIGFGAIFHQIISQPFRGRNLLPLHARDTVTT